ncbi:MAG: class I adenylate-forming enzyme family protein [Acidimicrobiales bacterium]|nr:MAG: long-chain fatty acid--CoA ligase [Acidimicrobiales bacterium]
MPARPTFPDHRATVPGLLAHGRDNFAESECVVTPEERLSYSELESQSAVLAGRLVACGVGKGSRVGLLFPNGARWVLAWAAAARLGAVVIPVNTFYQAPELARFLHHSDVQYLLGVEAFLHHDYLDRLESAVPGLKSSEAPPLHLESLPQLRRVLLWDEPERPWAEGGLGAALEGPTQPSELAAVVQGMGEEVAPGDEALVTYTSGSTGEAKGVVHSHGALVRHARNLAALSNIDHTSRIWTPMPLCWVGGFAFTLLRALSVGGCFVTQEVFEAGAALRLLERERVTTVSAWPALGQTLIAHPDYPKVDLSALRGGSMYEAFPSDRRPPDPGLVVSSLGMSETCGPHTFWTPGEEVTGSPEAYRGSFGHEVPGTEHRIVDPDTGVDVPEGDEGEVLVRGYNLMLGLYKRERSEVFDASGWYHTGDRGYFRDGWFFFTGRMSDLIKTSGSNVAPGEVEAALLGFDEVKLAFVVGVEHPQRGQDVVALVVPQPGPADLTPDDLRRRLRDQLSSYKIPRQVFFVADADVPWLVSQKVDRRALAAMAAEMVVAEGPT